MSKVRVPPESELFEIAHDLNPTSSRAAELVSKLSALANEADILERYGITPEEARKRRLLALEEAVRGLRSAMRALSSEEDLLERGLRNIGLRHLSGLISLEGFRSLFDQAFRVHIDGRESMFLERDGGMEATQRRIQNAVVEALEKAPRPLVPRLLEVLENELEREIERTPSHAGGRPPRYVRDYVILELISIYEAATRERATTTAGGNFAQFCEAIFGCLQMNTQGLDEAIKRLLRRRKDEPDARG